MKTKIFFITLFAFAFLLSACQTVADSSSTNSEGATATANSSENTQDDVQEAAVETQIKKREHNGPIVLHNGLVITATGAEPIPNGAVVVENGLITAVGPEAEIEFPEGAWLIDVEGRAILPGLIDARASGLSNHLDLDEGQIESIGRIVYLDSALQSGVTTLRDAALGRMMAQEIADLRAALEAHGNTVPTLVLTGPFIAHRDGSAMERYPKQNIGVASTEEARETAAHLIEAGVDQIGFVQSITQESHLETRDGLPPILSQVQLEAIVEVAHGQDKWVLGQAVFPEEAEMALAAGVDQLMSWPSRAVPMPDDLIQSLVDDAVPVLSGFNVTPPQEGDVRRFLDAGGTLVFGTYAPNSGPMDSPYREFQVMLIFGMTPMEMIQSATANAARALELDDQIGTLETGKKADIIVVNGDPLQEFRIMREVIYVVKGGDLVVQPAGE